MIYDASRSRRNSCKMVDPKQCAVWPSLGHYSIEVQVQSLFQDQTVSWIRIVNGIDKFVREAMPIQEDEKSSVKPAARARPMLKPSSTSDVNFVNSTPHTSHFLVFLRTIYTHMLGSSHQFGVRTSHSMCHPHALMWLF